MTILNRPGGFAMKKSHFSEEQISLALRQAEAVTTVKESCLIILIPSSIGNDKGEHLFAPVKSATTLASDFSLLALLHYSSTSSHPVIIALMFEVTVWPVVVM